MSNKKLLGSAKSALRAVENAGATEARVQMNLARNYSITTKDNEVDLLTENQKKSITLTIIVDKKYGSFSTSDVNEESLKRFAEKSVAMVKVTDADPANGLPPKDRIGPLPDIDLELFDQTIADSKKTESRRICKEMTDAAKGVSDKVFFVEVSYSEADIDQVLLTSDGFEGTTRATQISTNGMVFARDTGDKKQETFDWRVWRHWADQEQPSEMGLSMAKRAVAQIGAAPMKTGEYPVVIDNRWGGNFANMVLQAVHGGTVYRKMSVLGEKKGEKIASDVLTLTDDPLIKRGLASTTFDFEGMVRKPMPVITNGVLDNFYWSSYWSRKQGGVEPTTGAPTNLVFGLGKRSGEEMAAKLDGGIYITEFIGGNFNSTSGDFSAGIRGFYFDKGERRPIVEMNIAGNLLEVLPKLEEVGNDPFRHSSVISPSIRYAPMVISGL